MSHSLAHKRSCSRCPRVEEFSISLEEAAVLFNGPAAAPDVSVHMPGSLTPSMTLDTLCGPCKQAVGNYLSSIFTRLEKPSPQRATEVPVETVLEG